MFRSFRGAGLLLAAVVGLSALSAYAVDALPVEVSLKDPAVHFVGRWDTKDAAAAKADWSASEIDLHFKGTAANIKLTGGKDNQFQVVVDGQPVAERIKLGAGGTFSLAAGLEDKEHTIQILKCTEPNVGAIHVSGFEISAGGKTLPWTAQPAHRIEMVGDSITCGYGNLDTDKSHHWSPATQNAYYTYGPITARAFNAECHIVAWSGRKMSPNNTIPEIYDRTLATAATPKWDFSQWTAEAVVINLATNDFGGKPPEEKAWTAAYEKFITDMVRKNYPKADVFISTSPMMYGDGQKTLKKYLDIIKADLLAAGDSKIHILNLAGQDPKDGYGADWHPNVTTQKKMAATLTKALETELGWKPVEVPADKAPAKSDN